jgi:hypothetical protein
MPEVEVEPEVPVVTHKCQPTEAAEAALGLQTQSLVAVCIMVVVGLEGLALGPAVRVEVVPPLVPQSTLQQEQLILAAVVVEATPLATAVMALGAVQA